MQQKVLVFSEDCISKNKFHMYQKPINIDKVNIKRIVLSHKESCDNKDSYKYFIGYIYTYIYISIIIMNKFPKMNAYAQYFHKNNKSINLLVNDQIIFEKCSKIWDEIKSLFRKKIDTKPVYNDNYIKGKVNLCNANFYVTKIPIEGEYCSILLLM